MVLGYLTHLLLDELWSLQLRGRPRIKQSFGTALKLWSRDTWGNASVYGKLFLCVFLLTKDPTIRAYLPPDTESLYRVAEDAWEKAVGDSQHPARTLR